MKKSICAIMAIAALVLSACGMIGRSVNQGYDNGGYGYGDNGAPPPPPPPANNQGYYYDHQRVGYTVDNRYVYFRGVAMRDADVRSFQDLGDGYGKDSRYVYYYGQRLQGENPRTFTGRSSDRRAGQRVTAPTTVTPPRTKW